MTYDIREGDCLSVMAAMPDASVDSIVSDPPYGLAFMGKQWDHGVPAMPFWSEALRVAKPGAFLVAFGGTRTYHRLTCAIEDAGWEIRDCLSYLYGSGFPKSHNLDKTGVFCGCESKAERDVRLVRDADVPPSVQHQQASGEVLLAGVPQSGAPIGQVQRSGDVRPRESGVEGWRDVEASEGQLLGGALRPFAGMGNPDGAEGRLHLGASPSDGAAGGAFVGADGSGASLEPRSVGQQAGELGDVAVERDAQESGVWPTCERCGKPRITRGLGTALKPAWEPIILARKPLIGTVAKNVAQYGTGGINVDGCRIGTGGHLKWATSAGMGYHGAERADELIPSENTQGRWPANVVLDEEAAGMLDKQTGTLTTNKGTARAQHDAGMFGLHTPQGRVLSNGDSGGASRFFFVAREGQCETANTVELSLSPSSEPADSARCDAATSASREAGPPSLCQRGQDCTADCTGCTPCQSRAPSAEPRDSTATTPTTPTCCESCGSALPATDESTNPANAERVEGVSVPVSGTRFLYSAKASRKEREAGLEGMPEREYEVAVIQTQGVGLHGESLNGKQVSRSRNHHPTVKPIALMRWLCRLVTPPNGLVLDPFTGSGTTGCAAVLEGFRFVGIEREAEYVEIARKRVGHWAGQVAEPDLFADAK